MSDHGHIVPQLAPPAGRPSLWRWALAVILVACVCGVSFLVVLVAFGSGETAQAVGGWYAHEVASLTEHAATPAPGPAIAHEAPAGTANATPSVTARRAAPAVADQPAEHPPAATSTDTATAGKAPVLPSFDIVRVAPSGQTVIAGRAAPGENVTLSDNGAQIGQARADARGEFVFVPQTPLAPGGRELTLASRGADGAVRQGDAPVIVLVPPSAATATAVTLPPPAVLLTLRDGAAPTLLQAPTSSENGAAGAARLGLDIVDYDDKGAIRFAGRAPAGSDVRLYIDQQASGDARSDRLGKWTLTPERTVDPGNHQLRVDQLAASGGVAARIELPFQRAELSLDALGQDRVVVQPHNTLWALARRAYGLGVRYTVIYQANRDQIRNPDLIYPGQVFAVPASEPPPDQNADNPKPASSTSVR